MTASIPIYDNLNFFKRLARLSTQLFVFVAFLARKQKVYNLEPRNCECLCEPHYSESFLKCPWFFLLVDLSSNMNLPEIESIRVRTLFLIRTNETPMLCWKIPRRAVQGEVRIFIFLPQYLENLKRRLVNEVRTLKDVFEYNSFRYWKR